MRMTMTGPAIRPAFSRKHYVAVAKAIATVREAIGIGTDWTAAHGVDAVASALAEIFAADNPKFSRERFARATRGDTCKG
jgi:hypothetical protein